MSSPTSRSLDALRKDGWTAEVVEKTIRIPGGRTFKRDLFGCIDIVAVKPGHKTMGIQACAGASHASRREKSIHEPRLLTWLAAGNEFEIWSWRKAGAAGKRKLWTLRREAITGVQLVNETVEPSTERSTG